MGDHTPKSEDYRMKAISFEVQPENAAIALSYKDESEMGNRTVKPNTFSD
jgi:hypothetical protein